MLSNQITQPNLFLFFFYSSTENATCLSTLIDFDFLINGVFLNVPLKKHIQEKNIPAVSNSFVNFYEYSKKKKNEENVGSTEIKSFS